METMEYCGLPKEVFFRIPEVQRQRMERMYARGRRKRLEYLERERLRKQKVRYEVRMSPELRERVHLVATAIFPESGRTDSRLVRAVLRNELPWLEQDEEAVKRLEKWQAENGIGDDGLEVGSRVARSPTGEPRYASLYIRIERTVRDRLKEAAVAIRTESSRKTPSGAQVVREVLRKALGMPSRDGGATLRRLQAWHDRGGTRTAVARQVPAEVENAFRERALSLLPNDDQKRYRGEFVDDRLVAVSNYIDLRPKQAMKIYRKETERLRRHMPVASAEEEAKRLVMRDHLWPPLGEDLEEQYGWRRGIGV